MSKPTTTLVAQLVDSVCEIWWAAKNCQFYHHQSATNCVWEMKFQREWYVYLRRMTRADCWYYTQHSSLVHVSESEQRATCHHDLHNGWRADSWTHLPNYTDYLSLMSHEAICIHFWFDYLLLPQSSLSRPQTSSPPTLLCLNLFSPIECRREVGKLTETIVLIKFQDFHFASSRREMSWKRFWRTHARLFA